MGEFVVVTFPDAAMIQQGTDAIKKLQAEDSTRGANAAPTYLLRSD